MLKLLNKNGQKWDEKQDIYVVSKYLSTKYLLVTKGKPEQWRNPVDTTLRKCAQVNMTRQNILMCISWCDALRRHDIISLAFLPKKEKEKKKEEHKLNQSWEKPSGNPKLRDILLFKSVRVVKGKIEERSKTQRVFDN